MGDLKFSQLRVAGTPLDLLQVRASELMFQSSWCASAANVRVPQPGNVARIPDAQAWFEIGSGRFSHRRTCKAFMQVEGQGEGGYTMACSAAQNMQPHGALGASTPMASGLEMHERTGSGPEHAQQLKFQCRFLRAVWDWAVLY